MSDNRVSQIIVHNGFLLILSRISLQVCVKSAHYMDDFELRKNLFFSQQKRSLSAS